MELVSNCSHAAQCCYRYRDSGQEWHSVVVAARNNHTMHLIINHVSYVIYDTQDALWVRNYRILKRELHGMAAGDIDGDVSCSDEQEIRSPLAGRVARIACSIGVMVKKGARLLTIESMKMENEILASRDGIVEIIAVSPGDAVRTGQCLITLK